MFQREGEGNQAARPLPLPLLTPATQATVPGFKIMGGFRSGHPFPALNTKSALTILVVVFILGFEGLFIRVYCIAIKSVTKSLIIVTAFHEYWTTPILTLFVRKWKSLIQLRYQKLLDHQFTLILC